MSSNSNLEKSSVRALVRYGPGRPEILHIDDELDGPAPQSAVDVFKEVTSTTFGAEPYGEHEMSVHCFADVLVLHLPDVEDRGLVATFDVDERTRSIDSLAEVATNLAEAKTDLGEPNTDTEATDEER